MLMATPRAAEDFEVRVNYERCLFGAPEFFKLNGTNGS